VASKIVSYLASLPRVEVPAPEGAENVLVPPAPAPAPAPEGAENVLVPSAPAAAPAAAPKAAERRQDSSGDEVFFSTLLCCLFRMIFFLLVFQDWEDLNDRLHRAFGTSTTKRDLSKEDGAGGFLKEIKEFSVKHPEHNYAGPLKLWEEQLTPKTKEKRSRAEDDHGKETNASRKRPVIILPSSSSSFFFVPDLFASYFHVTLTRSKQMSPSATSPR